MQELHLQLHFLSVRNLNCNHFGADSKHKLFALVNVQRELGQTAGCPRVNRANVFASFEHRKYKLFPLVNRRVVPRVVPTFRKLMCSKFMCLFLALMFSEV